MQSKSKSAEHKSAPIASHTTSAQTHPVSTDSTFAPKEPPTRDWLRLHEVIKYSGMSVNAFALHIGLPRSENLYQIKKGNHGISKALAELINRYYPSYSVGWLLSGDPGSKLPPDADHIELRNDSLIRLPEGMSNEADQALINHDGLLAPRIPVGAVVLLKQSEKLIAGKYYLVHTPHFSLVRKVAHTLHSEKIRLITEDDKPCDDIVLSRSEIENQYLVVKVLSDI